MEDRPQSIFVHLTKWQLDSFDGVFTFSICVSITLIVFIYWTFYYTLNWTKVKKKAGQEADDGDQEPRTDFDAVYCRDSSEAMTLKQARRIP